MIKGGGEMNRKGFTLVEIMIVVAIIALLAAIAIPNLLRARITANESSAKAMLKSMSTALESFRASQTTPTYPTTIGALEPAGEPAFIDLPTLVGETFTKGGYTFTYAPGAAAADGNIHDYDVSGAPVATTTGINSYVINEGGTVYNDNGATAGVVDATDTPIE